MSVVKKIAVALGILVLVLGVALSVLAAYTFGKRSGGGQGLPNMPPIAPSGIPPGISPGMPPGIPPAQPGMFGAGLPLSPSYRGPPMFAPPFYGPRLPLAERWYESGDSQLTMFDIPNRARGLKGCGGCNPEYSPVCGANGKTYQNSCCADNADVDIVHPGRCKRDDD